VAGVLGMTLAVLATWAQPQVIHHWWIVGAIVAGFAVGVPLSRVPLTAVPQRTALSHAFGGLAAGLVGTAKFYLLAPQRARDAHALPHDRDHRGDHLSDTSR
jgi:NAD(P) transhydrogenase subunit beta